MAYSSITQENNESNNTVWHKHKINQTNRSKQKGQKPCVFWLTGLSGSGKSTIANLIEQELYHRGNHTYLLDGDNIRMGINKDLGFSDKDRIENIRRVGEVSNLMYDAGLIVFCAFISPFQKDRDIARSLIGDGDFYEVFVDSPLSVCERRDPKGLYSKARKGEIPFFTGINSPYEKPLHPELMLDTNVHTAQECARIVVDFMEKKYLIPKCS